MKSSFIISLCIAYCFSAFAQNQEIENIALYQILKEKKSYRLDSVKIYVNKYAEKAPSLRYFSGKNDWHVKGVLKQDCYSSIDSINNINLERYLLKANDKFVKFVIKKKLPKDFSILINVYKRFYYCNKVYVLIWITYDYCSFTQVLVIFDKEGNIISTDSQPFLTYKHFRLSSLS